VEGSKLPAMVVEMVNPDLSPKSVPPRRQSPLVAEFVRKSIRQLLDLNFIRPSTASRVSPIVIARAPNRDWRFCIDFTEVNLCTKRLPFPLPNTKDLLARMAPFQVFAKLDLKKGFHQIQLDPDSRHFSAFVCSEGICVSSILNESKRQNIGSDLAPPLNKAKNFQFIATKFVFISIL
jgi:hypothetical protein